MDVSALKEKMTAVEEKSAQYLSELNSCRSRDEDVESALKELHIKLETCEKDKVLFAIVFSVGHGHTRL